jgi:hypothetical protein
MQSNTNKQTHRHNIYAYTVQEKTSYVIKIMQIKV